MMGAMNDRAWKQLTTGEPHLSGVSPGHDKLGGHVDRRHRSLGIGHARYRRRRSQGPPVWGLREPSEKRSRYVAEHEVV